MSVRPRAPGRRLRRARRSTARRGRGASRRRRSARPPPARRASAARRAANARGSTCGPRLPVSDVVGAQRVAGDQDAAVGQVEADVAGGVAGRGDDPRAAGDVEVDRLAERRDLLDVRRPRRAQLAADQEQPPGRRAAEVGEQRAVALVDLARCAPSRRRPRGRGPAPARRCGRVSTNPTWSECACVAGSRRRCRRRCARASAGTRRAAAGNRAARRRRASCGCRPRSGSS